MSELTGRMGSPVSTTATRRVASLLAAADDYDIATCDRLITAAVAEMDTMALIRDVVSPVLREAGNRWHRGELSVVQEHMLSGIVRRQLSYALDHHLRSADGPSVLFTTLSGERHEMGSLMGAVLAASRGFQCIYLGPDLPAIEIGRFCVRRPVHALAVSIVTQPEVIDAATQLVELRATVPPTTEIWVAGQAAMRLARNALPDGIDAIDTLDQFIERLSALRERTA